MIRCGHGGRQQMMYTNGFKLQCKLHHQCKVGVRSARRGAAAAVYTVLTVKTASSEHTELEVQCEQDLQTGSAVRRLWIAKTALYSSIQCSAHFWIHWLD